MQVSGSDFAVGRCISARLTDRFNVGHAWQVAHDVAELEDHGQERVHAQHGARRNRPGTECEGHPAATIHTILCLTPRTSCYLMKIVR